MLKSLFGKRIKLSEETIAAPITGSLLQLEDVPDPVFSQKLMGDGFAIHPTDHIIVAPINGQVIQVFHTKHAISLRSQSGLELFIHIGLETVHLNGEGFQLHVKEGQKVKVGEPLLSIDLSFIREKAASTITSIMLTNDEIIEYVEKYSVTEVEAGETTILRVKLK